MLNAISSATKVLNVLLGPNSIAWACSGRKSGMIHCGGLIFAMPAELTTRYLPEVHSPWLVSTGLNNSRCLRNLESVGQCCRVRWCCTNTRSPPSYRNAPTRLRPTAAHSEGSSGPTLSLPQSRGKYHTISSWLQFGVRQFVAAVSFDGYLSL